MLSDDIELLASNNRLDLQEIEPWHFRFKDQYSRFLFDIYIKKNKNGNFQRNSVGIWNGKDKPQVWLRVQDEKELIYKLKKHNIILK